jgi:putative addiction module component (TIGR02574 family)
MPSVVDPKFYRKLTPTERVRLMDDIYRSLVEEGRQDAIPGPTNDEVKRRVAAHRRGRTRPISWQEARRRLGWK